MLIGNPESVAIEMNVASTIPSEPQSGYLRMWVGKHAIGDFTEESYLAAPVMFFRRFIAVQRKTPEIDIRRCEPRHILSAAHSVCYDSPSGLFFGLSDNDVWPLVFVPRSPPFAAWFGIIFRVDDSEHFIWQRKGSDEVNSFRVRLGLFDHVVREFLLEASR